MQKTSLGIYFIVFLLALAGAVTFNSDRVLSVVPAVTGLPHSNVAWPRVGDEYADLELFNLEGEPVRMSQYRGKVLLIEAIGMPCAACQAFSGAHELGGFGGIQPQPGLQSFERYFQQYAGDASLSDERLVFIQILFYGPSARHAPRSPVR